MRMHSLKLGQWNKEGLNMEEATGEPGLGCLSSLGSQRKGGLGDRFRGLAWDKLPAAHCLRVWNPMPVGKEVGGGGEEGKGQELLSRGRARTLGPLS